MIILFNELNIKISIKYYYYVYDDNLLITKKKKKNYILPI